MRSGMSSGEPPAACNSHRPRSGLASCVESTLFRPLAWAAGLTLLFVFAPLLPAARLFPSPTAYLPAHTALEFVAMAVSAMVFALGWNLRHHERNSHAVLIGMAALGVALIDLAHTLSYKGMPDLVTPSDPEKAINFWLAGRLLAGLSLLVAAILPLRQWPPSACRRVLAGSLAVTGVVWWIGLWRADWLPRTFIAGQGLTPFKVGTEYVLALICAAAALGHLRRACRQRQQDPAWLAAAAWTLALTELFFTLYQDVTDLFNLLGHIYKAIAYVLIYRAIFVGRLAAPFQALRESEQRLNNAMSATGEGLWEWHIDDGVVYHNARWCELLGLDEHFLSHPIADFEQRLHADDRAEVMARIQRCLDGAGAYFSEHRLQRTDGRFIWVMDRGDVVERAADGRALRMAGSLRDITELHEARQALESYREHLEQLVVERTRELEASRAEAQRYCSWLEQQANARAMSEARFRLAMEVGTTVAYTLDRDLRYTWAHSCRPGFDERTVLGKTQFEIFAEDTARMTTALYHQVMAAGTGLRRDIAVRSLANPQRERHFELVVEPMKDASGAVSGLICAAVEITERKRVEAELRGAKADAERANNAKSRFLAAASHDLRQPLAALNLYIETLARAASGDAPLLASMKDCVASLSRMLSDLLDLSKLEAGVVTPEISEFPLGPMLATVVAVHTPEAHEKGLTLRCAATDRIARTDPVLLARIVGNFVANAVRYTDQGGVLVGCRRRHGKLWVEVWDTGIGIPADKTGEIFEEFRQLGNEARSANRGSGLGLAIAGKAADLLGLEIRVRSRLGKGSLFAIEVPRGQTVAPAVRREFTVPSLRIALVEDDARVAQALVFALSALGHRVVSAADGAEIVARLGGQAPDMVISDYRLADGETGFDVVAALRAAFAEDLPALVVTGDTDPQLLRQMAAKGVLIRHKPIDLEVLQGSIAELTGGEVS